jgi:hypothetical protein
MMKELGAIRDALRMSLAKDSEGAAGAIERVATITLREIEGSSPVKTEQAVQS